MFDGLNFELEPDYSWATLNDQTISIRETDIDNEGTFPLKWLVCPAMTSSVGCATATFTIKLAACMYDEITPTVPIASFDYIIDGGPVSIGPNMQQRFDDCKVNYELR